jgi:cellulose synthase/poly-beta-1,6-N-acetylglucosamine synthase-like glycosyltransferase
MMMNVWLIASAALIGLLLLCELRYGLVPVLDFLLRNRRLPPMPTAETWPSVAVQLAVYREHLVLPDLIDAVIAMDYPREHLSVQVLDDSTGDDAASTKAVVEQFASCGVAVTYLNRGSRRGFKAGALNYGMASVNADFLVYFDADCKPHTDFLRRTVPYMKDRSVAAVQARWDFSNATHSPLTQLQAGMFEWLFRFEIPVRAKLGLPSFYMGSAAVWRKAAIEREGGWQEEPFTAEDLDLSLRLGTRGWRVLYQPELLGVTIAVEDVLAFRAQQRRWARSQMQTARDNWGGVIKARWGVMAKLFDLTLAFTHGIGIILLFAAMASAFAIAFGVERTSVWVTTQLVLCLCVIASPLTTTLLMAQRSFHADWPKRAMLLARALPAAMAMTTSDLFGVADYLRRVGAEFVVTPKGGQVGVVKGSKHRWLSAHVWPLAFEAVIGSAITLASIAALFHYPESFLPLALVGGGMLISFAQALRAIQRHDARLRAGSELESPAMNERTMSP